MRVSKKLGGWGRSPDVDEAAGGVVDLEVEAGEVVVGDLGRRRSGCAR